MHSLTTSSWPGLILSLSKDGRAIQFNALCKRFGKVVPAQIPFKGQIHKSAQGACRTIAAHALTIQAELDGLHKAGHDEMT